jgi:WD40 repeat protein
MFQGPNRPNHIHFLLFLASMLCCGQSRRQRLPLQHHNRQKNSSILPPKTSAHQRGTSILTKIIITSNPLAAIVIFCNADNTIYSYSINGQLISRVHEKLFSHFLSPIVVKDSKLFEYVIFGNERSEVHVKALPFLEVPTKNIFKVARDVCVNKICISKHNRFMVTGCSDGELTIITDPNIVSNT